MHRKTLYCAGTTPAVRHAAEILSDRGFSVANTPCWDTGHLLLDIPSFQDDRQLRNGGNLDTVLASLPKDTIVWGGNLNHPSMEGYHSVDLLKDEYYLAENAAITADCALKIAAPLLAATWQDSPALVIGWGRIGKCLSKLLKAIGNDVTVASSNPAIRAALHSMGYNTADSRNLNSIAGNCRIVFNTAPGPVITKEDVPFWDGCIKIDLASKKGIAGGDVLWARGLPGIHAPESSGKLIAETVCRLWKEMEQ